MWKQSSCEAFLNATTKNESLESFKFMHQHEHILMLLYYVFIVLGAF